MNGEVSDLYGVCQNFKFYLTQIKNGKYFVKYLPFL